MAQSLQLLHMKYVSIYSSLDNMGIWQYISQT